MTAVGGLGRYIAWSGIFSIVIHYSVVMPFFFFLLLGSLFIVAKMIVLFLLQKTGFLVVYFVLTKGPF